VACRTKTNTPPLAFIINEHTPAFADVLSGMQSAGRALIVQEGGAPAVETFKISLPDGVKVEMRTTELVNPDGSVDLQPDVIVAKGATDAALKALQENRIAQRPLRNSGLVTTK